MGIWLWMYKSGQEVQDHLVIDHKMMLTKCSENI
jgi:hypothetical protein